ncbi:helix-turn-helix domain protein [Stanieria cyanosphaera PCC 7437]|uniref:Helix-turn-helix domain protein n=1 Tax=Stanieria cyanosphaera (strain ATCC 29371 / PCC 7437) TaxID=111780 RepID=K9XTV6_STAC7|nr:XRE family transcriptional regulator [Stanieria cyanosphaera]AFZ35983.1 helix-turn-helix domain protein [Stanieria cyanosphaera PCC 7437]
MSGNHAFSKLTAEFASERREEIANRASKLKTEMALKELRQAFQLSQSELASKLNVKQPAISRLEQRTDMYVSHLRQIIEAMGGQLDIVARFRDGEVKITNFDFTNSAS